MTWELVGNTKGAHTQMGNGLGGMAMSFNLAVLEGDMPDGKDIVEGQLLTIGHISIDIWTR